MGRLAVQIVTVSSPTEADAQTGKSVTAVDRVHGQADLPVADPDRDSSHTGWRAQSQFGLF
jgi:hypothetical protein